MLWYMILICGCDFLCRDINANGNGGGDHKNEDGTTNAMDSLALASFQVWALYVFKYDNCVK